MPGRNRQIEEVETTARRGGAAIMGYRRRNRLPSRAHLTCFAREDRFRVSASLCLGLPQVRRQRRGDVVTHRLHLYAYRKSS